MECIILFVQLGVASEEPGVLGLEPDELRNGALGWNHWFRLLTGGRRWGGSVGGDEAAEAVTGVIIAALIAMHKLVASCA